MNCFRQMTVIMEVCISFGKEYIVTIGRHASKNTNFPSPKNTHSQELGCYVWWSVCSLWELLGTVCVCVCLSMWNHKLAVFHL